MDAKAAAESLGCSEEETEYHEKFFILQRMAVDKEFEKGVVDNFKPSYFL